MKKALLFMLALGLMMLFSSAALAEFGQCDYATHVQRTEANKNESTKTVVAKDASKIKDDKLVRLQEDDLKKPEEPKK